MWFANSTATVPCDSPTEISGVYYFPGPEPTLERHGPDLPFPLNANMLFSSLP